MPTAQEIAERKRVRRQAALIGLSLFTPWKLLRTQIALSTHSISTLFDTTDRLIDDGYSVKEALFVIGRIADPAALALEKAIHAGLMAGYKAGYGFTGEQVRPASYAADAARIAKARGQEVSAMMNKWTRKTLKKNINNQYVTSEARALRAVKFEIASHYYEGLLGAVAHQPIEKTWLTTSDDPCETCIENEDAGWIPVSSEFPSGDYAPLAHLNCQCMLSLQPA